ncbi:hypothetical protein F5Y11DRAFT_346275 [Daldinia sp. FL1419]|nr:hypothetical protein F5Y11DRAFT_346275 [Daldinia sp. FL1419]
MSKDNPGNQTNGTSGEEPSSPKPDEPQGEIVQCSDCHCWILAGQEHVLNPAKASLPSESPRQYLHLSHHTLKGAMSSYAGSETSKDDFDSDGSKESTSDSDDSASSPASSEGESENTQEEPDTPVYDADDERSTSDNNDSRSIYNSPEQDETEGEIVQCKECHCWIREGQSHVCEPMDKDRYA